MSVFKITTVWNSKNEFTYEQYNRDHKITFSGPQTLINSAAPEYYGNEDMANPEELLAAAVSSCHMLTFLAVCSKTGFKVTHYEDDAVAMLDKNDEGKMAVTQINLHPKIQFDGATPDETKLRDLHNKAHRNCFIAQSIKTKVEVVF
ncbi:MAG: OsmC family protein [Bacteriovoracaceae bacterium]|nr:OsmC family protein [Bacteriovoracaceae bacterium]